MTFFTLAVWLGPGVPVWVGGPPKNPPASVPLAWLDVGSSVHLIIRSASLAERIAAALEMAATGAASPPPEDGPVLSAWVTAYLDDADSVMANAQERMVDVGQQVVFLVRDQGAGRRMAAALREAAKRLRGRPRQTPADGVS